jgi:nucleotide-binding universal stress UspA family protein
MKRILVGVDGSDPSHRAVRLATDIGARFGSKLTLLHVIPPTYLPPDAYGAAVTSLEEQHRAEAERLLRETVIRLEEPGVEIETLVLYGRPADILAEVASGDVDLVVIGSSGKGAASRLLLGSVSGRLMHLSTKPVLVVH